MISSYGDPCRTRSVVVTFSSGNTVPFMVTFTQSGTSVTGTFTDPCGVATGDVVGTVFGDTMSASFTQNPPCPGDFMGHFTLTGPDAFAGTYTGTGCTGPVDATIAGTRR